MREDDGGRVPSLAGKMSGAALRTEDIVLVVVVAVVDDSGDDDCVAEKSRSCGKK